jgi:hypothetical protein
MCAWSIYIRCGGLMQTVLEETKRGGKLEEEKEDSAGFIM